MESQHQVIPWLVFDLLPCTAAGTLHWTRLPFACDAEHVHTSDTQVTTAAAWEGKAVVNSTDFKNISSSDYKGE